MPLIKDSSASIKNIRTEGNKKYVVLYKRAMLYVFILPYFSSEVCLWSIDLALPSHSQGLLSVHWSFQA